MRRVSQPADIAALSLGLRHQREDLILHTFLLSRISDPPTFHPWSRWAATLLLLALSVGCAGRSPTPTEPELHRVKLLITSDVHGWLSPFNPRKTNDLLGGLGELATAWKVREGYDLDLLAQQRPRPFLILDAGDMWTGTPESTLAEGKPVIDVFNLMGYDGAALGNHEFDFGIEILRRNAGLARFPLLSSNVRAREGGTEVNFCKPSMLVDAQGLKVGVIGLSTLETPQTTFSKYVAGLEFINYEPQVREQARLLMQQGAQVLVVLAHEPVPRLKPTAEAITDLPIRVWIGGHSHRRELEVLERDPLTDADDVILLNPGAHARAYGRIDLLFDRQTLLMHNAEIVPLESKTDAPLYVPHPGVAAVVKSATQAVEARMGEKVGEVAELIPVGNLDRSPVGELVADSWLEMFPQAQLSVTNLGGLRQNLEPGPVTLRDIFNLLPFANDIVMVHLTAAQLREALSDTSTILGGGRMVVRYEGERRVVTRIELPDGTPLDEQQTYGVLTTDYLYAGGNNLPFKRMDPSPVLLGVNWREPVIEHFRKQQQPRQAPPPGRVRRE